MTPRLHVTELGDGAQVARAAGVAAERRGLLATLTALDGRIGEGEASPLPGYSRETLDDVRRELSEFAPRCGAARFAFESALVDLVGKRLGVPAATVLGGTRTQARVATAAVIVDDDPAPAAARAIASGATALKIKIGRDARADAAMLVSLRARVGPAIELRADANGRYSLDGARAFLSAVVPASLSFVEEPTSGGDLLSLVDSPVPIAIDESLVQPGMPPRALASRAVSVVILKPALLGLFAARALALDAKRAGKAVVVTHLFDGPWGLAAAAALALSLPFPPLACGLSRHDGLRAYPAKRLATVTDAWSLVASREPGLGVGAA